jgi:hypothetical protein
LIIGPPTAGSDKLKFKLKLKIPQSTLGGKIALNHIGGVGMRITDIYEMLSCAAVSVEDEDRMRGEVEQLMQVPHAQGATHNYDNNMHFIL